MSKFEPLLKYRKGTTQNSEVWGRDTARQRYGNLDYSSKPPPRPKDQSFPQFKEDQPADKTFNDVSPNSWLRGGGERGYPPNFDRGSKRK